MYHSGSQILCFFLFKKVSYPEFIKDARIEELLISRHASALVQALCGVPLDPTTAQQRGDTEA